MILSGMFLYNLYSVPHAVVRNLMFFCGGYFLESGISVFGMKETLDTMNDY